MNSAESLSSAFQRAAWIWTADDPGDAHVWVDARRRFEFVRPSEAVIEICADLRYFLWINGRAVGFGPPKFHWETPTVDRYEIGSLLRKGTNLVAVRVYSHGGMRNLSSCMPQRGALRAAILTGGAAVVTDRSWEVRRETAYASKTATRGECQPSAEWFDARKAFPPPWVEGGAGGGWQPAVEILEISPNVRFELRDLPLFGWQAHAADRLLEKGLARFENGLVPEEMDHASREIAAARRSPDRDGRVEILRGKGGDADRVVLNAEGLASNEGVYARWDFGRIWTGYPVLRIEGVPGTVVDVSYAETLKGGRLDPTKHGMNYVDRLILGNLPLEHRITWPKCFRYLQVDVRGGRAEVETPVLERSAYPVERRGTSSSSDPALDQAWEISAHTVELCMEDGYMDTPWRERGSWLGDDVPKMLANYAVFGDFALARRFLLQHSRGQLPTGQMAGKYPGWKTSRVSTWTLTFPVSVREYVRHSGDREFAVEILSVIERILGWMEQYRLPEGVYGNLPLEVTAETNIYNFIDWAPVDTSGANAAWNAYAWQCLNAAAHVARVAGKEKFARTCESRASELGHAFGKLFWDEERGVFVNGWREGRRLARWGCHENYLAVAFGMVDSVRRDRIVARLKQEDLLAVFKPRPGDYDEIIPGIDGNAMVAIALNRYRWDDSKMVPLGTPYFAWFALEALFELGMAEAALAMIGKHWGEFSRQGGTTVWETWGKDSGSLSHGWGCAPAIVLGKYILGVKLSEDPAVDVEILPQSGGLEWAKGRVNTPKGVVQVAWKRDRGGWRLEVDAPKDCGIRAGLPCGEGMALRVEGSPRQGGALHSRHGGSYRLVDLPGGRHTLVVQSG